MNIGLAIAQLAISSIIAGIVAYIAYQQLQNAQAKLRADLFDRRFAVFMSARAIVSEITQLGSHKDVTAPNEIVARGRFLFGSDIEVMHEELHSLTGRIEVGDRTALQEVDDWFKRYQVAITPYMKLGVS